MQAIGKGLITLIIFSVLIANSAFGMSAELKENINDPRNLKPFDSKLKVKAADPAPDFTLPSISGEKVTLSVFRGQKNVVNSFVPAAWAPVCSDQWPGYYIAKYLFQENGAVRMRISVDNIPTLHAWTNQMDTSIWFPVLSDFWPHGALTDTYGVLRSDGVSERMLFLIDKEGIIRSIYVADINVRPDLEYCAIELIKLNR